MPAIMNQRLIGSPINAATFLGVSMLLRDSAAIFPITAITPTTIAEIANAVTMFLLWVVYYVSIYFVSDKFF